MSRRSPRSAMVCHHGKGSTYTDGSIFYECMGCREQLDCVVVDDDGIDWSAISAIEAEYKKAKADAQQ